MIAHRGTWNRYVVHHQPKPGMSAAGRQRVSALMKKNNPMKRPDVVAKVSATTKGKPRPKSAEGSANIAAAARKRMLSPANPMKNLATYRAAMQRTLSRQTSKNELHFKAWCEARALPIQHRGDGSLWVGKRNPDFLVAGQRKVIEVTQKECFAGRRKARSAADYGMETIRHYRSKGWECLVVFKRDHRCTIPEALLPVIQDFASPESSWSGVWNYDALIPFGGSPAES